MLSVSVGENKTLPTFYIHLPTTFWLASNELGREVGKLEEGPGEETHTVNGLGVDSESELALWNLGRLVNPAN